MQHTAETLNPVIQPEFKRSSTTKLVVAFLTAELQKEPLLSDCQKESQLRALHIDPTLIVQARESNGGHITFLPSEPGIYFNYYPATLARLIVLFENLQPGSNSVFFCDVIDDQARPVKRSDISYSVASTLAVRISKILPEHITASVHICDLQVNGSITLPAEQSYYRIKVTCK